MEKYEKQCHKCKRVLPASMFYKRKESADGLQEWCKRGRKPSSFFGKMFKFFSKKRNSTFKIPLNNVVSIEHKKDKLVVVYKK